MRRPRRRALVADDDDAMRELVTLALQSAGFEVDAVADGDEVLAKVEAGASFALVVTDANMRRVGGLDVIAALTRRGHAPPVVLMSGDFGLEPDALEAGAAAFYPKRPGRTQEDLRVILTKLGFVEPTRRKR